MIGGWAQEIAVAPRRFDTPFDGMVLLPVNPGFSLMSHRAFNGYAGITVGTGGTIAYDANIVAPGEVEGCLKLTSGPATGLHGFDFDVSHLDLSGLGNITFWVYAPSRDVVFQNSSALEVLFTSTSYTNYYIATISRSAFKDGWARVQLSLKPGAHFATAGTGSPTWGEMSAMRFRVNFATGSTPVWISPLRYNAVPKAGVVITIDDMSIYWRDTLLPLMRERGLKGIGYVNKDMTSATGGFVGATTYATIADLIAAKGTLEYGSHATTHQSPGSRSYGTWKQDEWEANLDWMLANALITESDLDGLTAAYPFGDHGGATTTAGLESAIQLGIHAAYVVANGTPGGGNLGYGVVARHAFESNCAPLGTNGPMNLPRLTIGGTGSVPFNRADFDAGLQIAKDTGGILSTMWHHVNRSGATFNETTDVTLADGTYVLDQIAAAVAAGDVELTTPSALVREARAFRQAFAGRS